MKNRRSNRTGQKGQEKLADIYIRLETRRYKSNLDTDSLSFIADSDDPLLISDTDLPPSGSYVRPFLEPHPTAQKKDIPLAKLNPFAIEKGIKGLAGTPASVRRLRSGDLHSDCLLRSTVLAHCTIKVVPHRSMNSRKGVIRCRDLADTSEEDILENLSAQGITEVRKIRVQRDGRRINTGTIILTFGLPSFLPQ
ncbi:hypothetical protein LSH36_316g00005 [Paralvinella palmiformis]|uniref:Uncharacterized protein n=1 Tax=Paralvinella palmiformis TaxID=53620 RepID=A0AAD9N3E9_9ANNE|nr:hypothetical protein LSH36_316g00005 [Paralvinella palmiformis]